MSDPVFQQAYAAVRASFSDQQWSALTPKQITEAIYREIRRLDQLGTTAKTGKPDPDSPGRAPNAINAD